MKRWCSSIIKCAEIRSMRKPLGDIQLFYRKKGPIRLLCKIVTRIIQRKSADDAPDRRGREFGVFDCRSVQKPEREKPKPKANRLVCRADGGTSVLSAAGPWSGSLLAPPPSLPSPPAARARSPWGPGAHAGRPTLLWSPALGPLGSSSPPRSAALHRGTWWAAWERRNDSKQLTNTKPIHTVWCNLTSTGQKTITF